MRFLIVLMVFLPILFILSLKNLYALSIFLSFTAGLILSSMNVLRESSYEKFYIAKFFESSLITVLFCVLFLFLGLKNPFSIALTSYVLQRIFLETYEGFCRREKKKDIVYAIEFWKMRSVYSWLGKVF